MRFAARALDLGTPHSMSGGGLGGDVLRRGRLPEAGPASSGIELGLGTEQGRATTNALVRAGFMIIPVFAREGRLGSLPPRDLILFRRQFLLPIGIGLLYFFNFF